MQHAVQQHKLQNAICCPSILTVIIKTKILSFLNMHLVYCVDKTKLQFTSPLILFFSSLFLTASQSICVQRERKHDEIKKGKVCMRACSACGSRGEGGSCSCLPPVCVQQGCITQEKKEGASVTPHRGEDCTYCLFFARVSRLVSGCEKEAVPSIYAA